VVLSRNDRIVENDLPERIRRLPGKIPLANGTLEQIEGIRIAEALREAGWNKKLAARKLGIHRSTLYKKIEKYGIQCRPYRQTVSDTATQASNQ